MCSHRPTRTADLVGPWFHSHEEDSLGAAVYRPKSFAFPPARMPRDSIVLGADGLAEVGEPGPVDRLEPAPARWRLEGDHVVVTLEDGRCLHLTVGGPDQTVLIMRSRPQEGCDDDQRSGG